MFVVKIVDRASGSTAQQYGPMAERKAEKLERGLLMKVDGDRFFVSVEPLQVTA